MDNNQIDFLEVAESILEQSMDDYDKDPSAALKAAMFILSNKGQDRGWGDKKKLENLGMTPDQILRLNEIN